MRRPATASFDHAALPPPPLPSATTRWAMFLDVDGTLLEFVDDPQAVIVDSRLLRLLHALHEALDGALTLVSGRTLGELDRLFDQPSWALAGLHGLELRFADGTRRNLEIAAADQARMHEASHVLAARFAGVRLESKGTAMALHCRSVPEQFAALRAAADKVSPQLHGYEVQPGNLVVEFKPVGMDKGLAVDELLRTAPFSGRQPVYIGDDLTDEHAFACVNDANGLSVRVGAREPSRARYTLADPPAVEAWLRGVLTVLRPGGTADA